MKTTPPSRTADQFVIRLPDGMRQLIADAATANNRSMNAELVARLQDSLAGRTAAAELSTGDLLGELVARIGDRVQIVVSEEGNAIKPEAKSTPLAGRSKK